jgi:hypothetical protein
MEKLLAALSIPQVRSIRRVEADDPAGVLAFELCCSYGDCGSRGYAPDSDAFLFSVELNDRMYQLKVKQCALTEGVRNACNNRQRRKRRQKSGCVF